MPEHPACCPRVTLPPNRAFAHAGGLVLGFLLLEKAMVMTGAAFPRRGSIPPPLAAAAAAPPRLTRLAVIAISVSLPVFDLTPPRLTRLAVIAVSPLPVFFDSFVASSAGGVRIAGERPHRVRRRAWRARQLGASSRSVLFSCSVSRFVSFTPAERTRPSPHPTRRHRQNRATSRRSIFVPSPWIGTVLPAPVEDRRLVHRATAAATHARVALPARRGAPGGRVLVPMARSRSLPRKERPRRVVARGRASCDRNRRARRDEELITRHDEPSSRARVEAALLDGAPLRPLQRCVLASALLVVALALSIGLEVWVRRYVGRSVEVANERARLVRWRRLHRSELNRARGGSVGRERASERWTRSEWVHRHLVDWTATRWRVLSPWRSRRATNGSRRGRTSCVRFLFRDRVGGRELALTYSFGRDGAGDWLEGDDGETADGTIGRLLFIVE